MDTSKGGANPVNEEAPPSQRVSAGRPHNTVPYHACKAIILGLNKVVYRFDGVCKQMPQHTILTVRDPRDPYTRFRKPEPLDLPIPSFVLDNNTVGVLSKREVAIYSPNDNINEAFLRAMCEKVGAVSEVLIYRHPVSKKHLEMALVVFEEHKDASLFIDKNNGCSVMGNVITCSLDPYATKISKRYQQLTRERAPKPQYLNTVDDRKLSELRQQIDPLSFDEAMHVNEPSCSGLDTMVDKLHRSIRAPSYTPSESTPLAARDSTDVVNACSTTPKTPPPLEPTPGTPSSCPAPPVPPSHILRSTIPFPPPPLFGLTPTPVPPSPLPVQSVFLSSLSATSTPLVTPPPPPPPESVPILPATPSMLMRSRVASLSTTPAPPPPPVMPDVSRTVPSPRTPDHPPMDPKPLKKSGGQERKAGKEFKMRKRPSKLRIDSRHDDDASEVIARRVHKRRHGTCSSSSSSSSEQNSASEPESDLSAFQRKGHDRKAKRRRHNEAIVEEKRKYYKRKSYAEGSKDYYKEVVIRTVDESKERKEAGGSRSHGESRELVQEVERYQRIRRYKRRRSDGESSSETKHGKTEAGEQGDVDLPDLESVSSEEDSHRKRRHQSKNRRGAGAVNCPEKGTQRIGAAERPQRLAKQRAMPLIQHVGLGRGKLLEGRSHRWSSTSASEDSFSDTDEPQARTLRASKRMLRRRGPCKRMSAMNVRERDELKSHRFANKVVDLGDMMEEITDSSNESSDAKSRTVNLQMHSLAHSKEESPSSSQPSLANAATTSNSRRSLEQRLETLFHPSTPTKPSVDNQIADSPQTPSSSTPASLFTPVICDSSPSVTPKYNDRMASGTAHKKTDGDAAPLCEESVESWSALQEQVTASLTKQPRPSPVKSEVNGGGDEPEDAESIERHKKEEETRRLEALAQEKIRIEQEQMTAKERELRRRELERKAEVDRKIALAGLYENAIFERLMRDGVSVLTKDETRKLGLVMVEKLDAKWLEAETRTCADQADLTKMADADPKTTPTKSPGTSPPKSLLTPSSKNSLNDLVRKVAAQSKAEMSAAFGPDAAAQLGSDLLFQGFGAMRNMPSFKKKVVKPASMSKRDGSSDSSRSGSMARSGTASRPPTASLDHRSPSPISTPRGRSGKRSASKMSSRSGYESRSRSRSGSESSVSGSRSVARSLRDKDSSVFTAESDNDDVVMLSSDNESEPDEEASVLDSELDVGSESKDVPDSADATRTPAEVGASPVPEIEETAMHKSASAPDVAHRDAQPCTPPPIPVKETFESKTADVANEKSSVSEYDVFRNDHCYFKDNESVSPEAEGVNMTHTHDLVENGVLPVCKMDVVASETVVVKPIEDSAILKSATAPNLVLLASVPVGLPSKIKKARRKRINNELAALLPPPVDVSRLHDSDFEDLAETTFDARTPQQAEEALYAFRRDGLDKEDLVFLEKTFHEMQNDGTANWSRNLFWVPPCDVPVVKQLAKPKRIGKTELFYDDPELLGIAPHSTGCARTQGYYRLSNKQKRGIIRRPEGFQDRTEISERDETTMRHIVQATREARSDNRRLLTSMGDTNSDFFKVNQLKYRKKMIKFARSRIHGWGLYALEMIAPDEMIVEYVGQMVRPTVADVREQRYIRKGMGSSYLFRIDSDRVIDATKMGNFARFINHSCQPDCYAKVVVVDGEKRIVIYSKTVIRKGDEITYDYKFPIEEDDKIDCLCGAPGCRGFLN